MHFENVRTQKVCNGQG